MKTIKKIDLINRIANGTEPERFIDNNILWYKGKSDKEHYYGEGGKYQLNVIRLDELNDEIELFDEEDEYEPFEEDKKIEKIKVLNSDDENDISSLGVTLDLKTLKNKTNEIIDYLMENKQ